MTEINNPDTLIHAPAGRAHSAKELGFTELSFRALPDPSPFALITGAKP